MKNSTVKTVSMMMMIMLVGKAMGLARESMLAVHYGIESMEAAAFTVANQIPKNFLDAMFASAISASFMPIFNDYLEKRGREEAYRLAYNFLNIIILFTGLMTVIGIVCAYPIVDWAASGYTEQTKLLAVSLLQILFPLLIASSIAFSLIGVVQSLGEFNIPAAMSVVSNGIIILYYLFFIDQFGIYGLAVAFLLGWISQILIQIPFLREKRFKYRFYVDFKDPGLKQIFLLMLPVMVSTWVQPINVLIHTRVASTLFEGSGAGVNALNYANTLYTVVAGVFIMSVANVIFPKLAKQESNCDESGFGETLHTSLHAIFYFLIPMTFGMIVLAEPLIRLIFQIEGGRFDALATQITAKALRFYLIGIVGLGIQTILARGFYALKDGKTPLLTGLIAISVNLVLSQTLLDSMDVAGPALASSISISVAALIMIWVMGKKHESMLNRPMLTDTCKMLFASAVMSIAVLQIRDVLLSFDDNLINRILVLLIPTVIGLAIYIAITFFGKLYEAQMIFQMLKRKK